MLVLSFRACISFGPKNRSIGAAAKSQVEFCFFHTYFCGWAILPMQQVFQCPLCAEHWEPLCVQLRDKPILMYLSEKLRAF